MFYKINVLQLGLTNLADTFLIHESVKWFYEIDLNDDKLKNFDVLILSRNINSAEKERLFRLSKAYCVFVYGDFKLNEDTLWLFKSRVGKTINKEELETFLKEDIIDYYGSPYGEKYRPNDIAINDNFKGNIFFDGQSCVSLDGDYGSKYRQIVYWRTTIPLFKEQSLDLWLEYEKDKDVSIKLSITQFVSGTLSTIQNSWLFTEEDMKDIVYITNHLDEGPIFISVLAKGKGKLKIVGLHDRYSRRGKGHFLIGGERIVTRKREEAFFYFDPGDMKPPLNVYFSGYKTQEGFEGYNMLKKMGAPFLLISESRLEGGAFYLGDEEYENKITEKIKYYLDKLGFTNKEMIMSGLSMGTFGALYYGCDLRPFSIVIGKPLCNLGDMASNERINRPYSFPTSLDVLNKQYGNLNLDSINKLNKYFWDKFDSTDFSDTKFVVSYMIEDDYDFNAYNNLLAHINDDSIEVYGKGIHGRHNDNTYGIVSWFIAQYNNLINIYFKREFK